MSVPEGTIEGRWAVHTVDGAEVRLRSGRIGLVSVDVKAPVTGGELTVAEGSVRLTLRLALDQLKTGNFLLQAAARIAGDAPRRARAHLRRHGHRPGDAGRGASPAMPSRATSTSRCS